MLFSFFRDDESSPWIRRPRMRSKSQSPTKPAKKLIKFATLSVCDLGPAQILDACSPSRYTSFGCNAGKGYKAGAERMQMCPEGKHRSHR